MPPLEKRLSKPLDSRGFWPRQLTVLGLSVVLLFAALDKVADAQSSPAEPAAAGIFYFLDSSETPVPLEYRAVQRQTTKLQVQGDRSPVRFREGTRFRFLVRLQSGTAGIDQLDVEQGWRTIP